MNHSNWMILGARESWRSLLSPGTKILKIRRAEFFKDDFEKIFLKIIWDRKIFEKSTKISLKSNFFDFSFFEIFRDFQDFQDFSKNSWFFFKNIFFQSHLKKISARRNFKFWYLEKAEIISFYEHLKSFNSYDSSPSYRPKRGCYTICTDPVSSLKNKAICTIWYINDKHWSMWVWVCVNEVHGELLRAVTLWGVSKSHGGLADENTGVLWRAWVLEVRSCK